MSPFIRMHVAKKAAQQIERCTAELRFLLKTDRVLRGSPSIGMIVFNLDRACAIESGTEPRLEWICGYTGSRMRERASKLTQHRHDSFQSRPSMCN